jgi:Tol biopolymer transport system component
MNMPAKWVTLTALLTILAVSGCIVQAEGVSLVASRPAATSRGDEGSALHEPQPSPVLQASPATPSPAQAGPSAAPSPSLIPTDAPLPTPTSTATPIPSPTPTPMPVLRRLSEGACCTQPFWSADSQQVLYIDKPGPDQPTGIWGLGVAQAEPTPELVTERIAYYSPDMTLASEIEDDATVIERVGTTPAAEGSGAQGDSTSQQAWKVPTGGRPVSISPGQKRITWQVSDEDLPSERRVTQIWVANLDGSDAQMVTSLPRGGFSGWVSDDTLLLSGRETLQSEEQVLFTLSLIDGRRLELARGKRLRGGLLSPDGSWLVYMIALDEDAQQNGVWLVGTDGSGQRKLEDDLFGAYQWRDAQRLLIIPFRPQATSHEIWQLNVETGQARRLTDPEHTPFKIANGDWSVSPDGRYVVFVESRDHNMWLLRLPD